MVFLPKFNVAIWILCLQLNVMSQSVCNRPPPSLPLRRSLTLGMCRQDLAPGQKSAKPKKKRHVKKDSEESETAASVNEPKDGVASSCCLLCTVL